MHGLHQSATGSGSGVRGESFSPAGYGVYGVSTGTAVYAEGLGSTVVNPALRAETKNAAGIALVAEGGASTDAAAIFANSGSGPLFKGLVNGNPVIRFTATGQGIFNAGTQTGGADLAEFIPVTDGLEAGDVAEIDPENAGHFRRCSATGSQTVAGVISTQPGVTLGALKPAENENQGPQLALAGRVPVKVTGEGGSIRAGRPVGELFHSRPRHAGFEAAAHRQCAGQILGPAREREWHCRDAGDVEVARG